jgi:hypothetical protein
MSAGFIYRLSCDNLCYYGSSRKVKERIDNHKSCYNYYKNHGGDKCYSVLLYELAEQKGLQVESDILERFEDISKEDLKKREQYYLDNYECVNENRAITTDEEKKEIKKIYYENNKEHILQYLKDYYTNNKEDKLQYQKKYTQKNSQKVAEYQKQYQQKNVDKLAEYHKNYNKQYEKQYREKRNQKQRERRAKKKLLKSTATSIITKST